MQKRGYRQRLHTVEDLLRDNKIHLNKYWLLDKDSVYILLYEQ